MNITKYYSSMDLNSSTSIVEIPKWNSVYFITSKAYLSRAIWVVKEWLGCVGIKIGYNKYDHCIEILSQIEPSIPNISTEIYNKKGIDNEQIFVVKDNTVEHKPQTTIVFNELLNGRTMEVHLINIMDNPICFLNNESVAFGRILGQGFYPVLSDFDNSKMNEFITEMQSLSNIVR